jgi:imidazolonepropionase-like amidohydrolase
MSGVFALRAAKAFDGERLLPGGAMLLVEGGRIVGVEGAGFAVPDGVEVVDVPRGTLLPGLINAHVHLCGDSQVDALERLPQFSAEHLQEVITTARDEQLASGVCTVRDLGDDRWALVGRRDAAPAAGAQPHIVASGPPITSIGGHCWMMGGEVSGTDALRAAVAERAERKVDVVKIMASGGAMTPGTDIAGTQFTLEELRCVVDESHRHGRAVTAHAHAKVAVEQAIDAGVDGIEHCTCVTAESSDFSAELMGRLRDRGIAVCPTLGRALDVTPPPRVLEIMARFGLSNERRVRDVAAAHAAGVWIVSGDDAGINHGKRHGVFAEAVVSLHDGGVSVADSLASATSVAAKACGLDARKGRLAAGYDADLLVVDGDATVDPTALRSVAMVLLGGTLVVDHRLP